MTGFFADFDPTPLFLSQAFSNLVLTLVIAIAAQAYPFSVRHALRIFAGGKLVIALAMFGVVLGGGMVRSVSLPILNTLLVLGTYCNFAAIRALAGKRQRRREIIEVALAIGLGVFWFDYIQPDMAGVRLVTSWIVMLIMANISRELLFRSKLRGAAHRVAGVTSLVMIGLFLLRCLHALTLAPNAHPIPAALHDPVENILWLLLGAAGIVSSVSFVLMASDVFNARLSVLAASDPLTGLANRREFYARGVDLLRRSRVLTVIMIDIDFFKRINDTKGHAVGDEALCAVAKTLRDNIRGVDLVGRIGGEEFAVLLPEADAATAGRIAERVRGEIAALVIPAPPGPPISLTVSLGIACSRDIAAADPTSQGFERLMGRADAALYRAKALGRDRVCRIEAG